MLEKSECTAGMEETLQHDIVYKLKLIAWNGDNDSESEFQGI